MMLVLKLRVAVFNSLAVITAVTKVSKMLLLQSHYYDTRPVIDRRGTSSFEAAVNKHLTAVLPCCTFISKGPTAGRPPCT